MRAAQLWGLAVLLTGCASQPVPQPVFEPLDSQQRAAEVAPAKQESSPRPEPRRERHVVWWASGQKAEEGWIVDRQRHGRWTTWHEKGSGTRQWQGEYDAGNPIGVWKYWSSSGTPQSQKTFVDGELRMVRKFSGVRLSAEEHFVDGVREGEWTKIASDGTVTSRYYNRGATVSDPLADDVNALGYRLKYAADANVRVQAASDLAQHSAQSWNVVPDLLRGLSDPDTRVVRECAVVLGIMGAEEAVGSLTGLTEHQDRPVAEAAKAALRQIEGEDRAPR